MFALVSRLIGPTSHLIIRGAGCCLRTLASWERAPVKWEYLYHRFVGRSVIPVTERPVPLVPRVPRDQDVIYRP